jgi:hypothetical protein
VHSTNAKIVRGFLEATVQDLIEEPEAGDFPFAKSGCGLAGLSPIASHAEAHRQKTCNNGTKIDPPRADRFLISTGEFIPHFPAPVRIRRPPVRIKTFLTLRVR